jgi:hypothetical protein
VDEDMIEGTVALEDILGSVVAGPESAAVRFTQFQGDWVARFVSTHRLRWPDGRSGPVSLLFQDLHGRTFLRAPVPSLRDVVLGPSSASSSSSQADQIRHSA